MWCRRIIYPPLLLALLMLAAPRAAFGRQESGEVLVPKDETFALELLSPLDSKSSRKGDKFTCKVLSPVQHAGALVTGHVRRVKSSGKANGKSEMDLAFDTIVLSDGRAGVFSAQVKEVNEVANAAADGRADAEGTVKGQSRVKVSVKRAAIGAGLGAIIGGALGGGQGAALGAAIGAGLGLTTTLMTEGRNLEFKAGTQFTVLTNAPSRRRPALEGAAARPVPPKPEPPSQRYRTYSGGAFSLSVPDNWRESVSGGTVTFAPDGAYFDRQGVRGYTHCAMAGTVPVGGRDLQRATEVIVSGLVKSNAYLRQEGAYRRWQWAERPAVAVSLSGIWPATAQDELITVYTTTTQNGDLFFLVAVAPREDAATYQPTFEAMLRSARLNR